ncbi:MAG: phosphatase family protein [Actinomycetia bacterium]|nr:phosphatase family protein [Actinomycetes bacterium]
MQPVIVALVAGLLGGLLVGCAAYCWPTLAAPKVAPVTVLEEGRKHPSIARALWSRIDAIRLGGLALGFLLLVAILGGALLGVLAWMIRSDVGLAHYDSSAAHWGARHATSASTTVLRDLSQLGGTWGSIAVALATAVVASRKLRPRSVVLFLVVVMVGESVLVAVIKGIVGRARPNIDRLTGFSGASFPSGHAATAAATFAAIALLLGYSQTRSRRAVIAGVCAAVAVTVAATRVLLGVHWLTDVVAGLVLGWTWFAIVSFAFGGRLLRLGAPIEAAQRVLTKSPG